MSDRCTKCQGHRSGTCCNCYEKDSLEKKDKTIAELKKGIVNELASLLETERLIEIERQKSKVLDARIAELSGQIESMSGSELSADTVALKHDLEVAERKAAFFEKQVKVAEMRSYSELCLREAAEHGLRQYKEAVEKRLQYEMGLVLDDPAKQEETTLSAVIDLLQRLDPYVCDYTLQKEIRSLVGDPCMTCGGMRKFKESSCPICSKENLLKRG